MDANVNTTDGNFIVIAPGLNSPFRELYPSFTPITSYSTLTVFHSIQFRKKTKRFTNEKHQMSPDKFGELVVSRHHSSCWENGFFGDCDSIGSLGVRLEVKKKEKSAFNLVREPLYSMYHTAELP